MKYDLNLLDAILKDMIARSQSDGSIVSESVAIGKIGHLQIQLTATNDRDEHLTNSKRFRCITPGP